MKNIYSVENTLTDENLNISMVSKEMLFQLFSNKLKADNYPDLKLANETIHYSTRNSLFSIKYPLSLSFAADEEKISVSYNISLIEMFKINTLVGLIAIFFSRMSMLDFIYFFIIIFSAFYFLNRMFIVMNIKRFIVATLSVLKPTTQTEPQDQSFMHDLNRCPACGNYLQVGETKCIACGLQLPKRKQVKRSTAIKYEELQIKYEFKEKKKPKE